MAQYFPDIFEVNEIEQAKTIILTPENGDTDARWRQETPYTIELLHDNLGLDAASVVLDYGCGIGRLSRAMIEAFGCRVIGVDISRSMRRLADDYVASGHFVALSPEAFDTVVAAGLRVDAFISVWVLQHCFNPVDDIARIDRALISGGRGFVMNMRKRAIPAYDPEQAANQGFFWAADEINVASLLESHYEIVTGGIPDQTRIPNVADAGAYWRSVKKRS